MSGKEDMIAWAEKSLGLGESPPGSNRNYITAWYGLVGPWCDMSISYWGSKSGNGTAIGKFAYTVAHANWFKSKGLWHPDIAGIVRGDIVFFDWNFSNSIGAIDHVGLVTGTSGSQVLTIEGNTANVCARRVRTASTIVGYGRPSYTGTPAPLPKPTGYQPYPGAGMFHNGSRSPIIARMHDRLVAVGCNKYATQTNKDVWGSGDKASYTCWQKKNGFSGTDANGTPGAVTWARLKVPRG